MKKANVNEEYEQLTMDFGEDFTPVETIENETKPKKKKTKAKGFELGAEIAVNPEIKRFCDGRGIPDYARRAYIKRINLENKTIVIETEPNGKQLGLLFMSDVTLI